jgi:hypothetical protein
LDEIIVEPAHDGIQPTPIVGHRLEDDGVAVTPNSDLLAVKAEFLREPNRLRSSGPEKLGCRHFSTSRRMPMEY